MYGDQVTPSMEYAISETNRRREIQEAYNKANGITPTTITKKVAEILEISTHKEDNKGTRRLSAIGRRELVEKLN